MGHSGTIGRAAKMGWKKKLYRSGARKLLRSCAHDPILSTQRIPRGRDPIFPTQRIGAAGIRFYLHKRDILKLLNPSIPKAKGPEIDSPKKKDFL